MRPSDAGTYLRTPCRYVPELPADRPEIDYLRVDETERYLDACAGPTARSQSS